MQHNVGANRVSGLFEYEELKINLALKFKNDRGAYVLGKASFIAETINLIKKTK